MRDDEYVHVFMHYTDLSGSDRTAATTELTAGEVRKMTRDSLANWIIPAALRHPGHQFALCYFPTSAKLIK